MEETNKYYRLAKAIFIEDGEVENINYDDIDETFKYVLSTLTEKESKVINLRFLTDPKYSLKQIASELERSPERIRQIEAKALRKLRHPSRFRYLKEGKNIIEERNATRKEAIDQYSNDPENDIPIENLNLSVRIYNPLKRAGINSIYDILRKSESDIVNIRNLGRRGADEVFDKIEEIGYHIHGADHILLPYFNNEGNCIDHIDDESNIKIDNPLDIPLEDLKLSTRAYNSLKHYGKVETVRDILHKSKKDLLGLINMGPISFKEVIDKLESLGFVLRDIDNNILLPYYETKEHISDNIVEDKINKAEDDTHIGISNNRYYGTILSAFPEYKDYFSNKRIELLNFSYEVYNAIHDAGISTIADLCLCSANDLMAVKGIDNDYNKVFEIIDKCAAFGVYLRREHF